MAGSSCVAVVGLLALASSPVLAEPPTVQLEVRGACPTADAVSSSLTQILPALRFGEGVRLAIEDRGASYRVAVARATRSFTDPARNCEERARVAAIFANAVLAPPMVDAPADAPSSQSMTPPRKRSRIDVELELSGAFDAAPRRSPNNNLVSGGGTLRLFVGGQHWGGVLGAGAQSPVKLDLYEAKARVVRVPLDLSLRGRLQHGRWALALDAGLAVVPFVARGLGLTTDLSGGAVEAGVRLAPRATCWLTPRVGLFLAAELLGIPVPQRFHVESGTTVGTMPPLWLGATAGLTFRAH